MSPKLSCVHESDNVVDEANEDNDDIDDDGTIRCSEYNLSFKTISSGM